ncbi:Heat shock protein, Hsp 20 family [Desulfonema limicola]|uniref:Heat shock protein, Hsp 20 family n=1 Tax=Desulfonema limicola TaxID=45656 RepID=A0A975B7R6_9BACT|nr:Hsp20/alpha crystallin family protein [Desulfonema limicola]QTA80135.1 Heat shock protein, Hsp 20 family [Desulfonema limicola]
MADTKDLQVREKQEAAAPGEYTRPGLVFTPRTDIFENEKEIVLLADMPGVKPEDLNIDLRENVLTLSGDVSPFEGAKEQNILMEYDVGKYQRQFTLSEIIDQPGIEARLNNGVLRLTLPKIAKAQPRKITVNS